MKFPKDVLLASNSEPKVAVPVEIHEESNVHTFPEMYADILLVEHNVIRAEEMRSMLKDVQATAVLCCHNYDSETIQLDAFYACVSCS